MKPFTQEQEHKMLEFRVSKWFSECRRIKKILDDWGNKQLFESQLNNLENKLIEEYEELNRVELENDFIQDRIECWYMWDPIDMLEKYYDQYSESVYNKVIDLLYS